MVRVDLTIIQIIRMMIQVVLIERIGIRLLPLIKTISKLAPLITRVNIHRDPSRQIVPIQFMKKEKEMSTSAFYIGSVKF